MHELHFEQKLAMALVPGFETEIISMYRIYLQASAVLSSSHGHSLRCTL
jgi:hypothetical protein